MALFFGVVRTYSVIHGKPVVLYHDGSPKGFGFVLGNFSSHYIVGIFPVSK